MASWLAPQTPNALLRSTHLPCAPLLTSQPVILCHYHLFAGLPRRCCRRWIGRPWVRPAAATAASWTSTSIRRCAAQPVCREGRAKCLGTDVPVWCRAAEYVNLSGFVSLIEMAVAFCWLGHHSQAVTWLLGLLDPLNYPPNLTIVDFAHHTGLPAHRPSDPDLRGDAAQRLPALAVPPCPAGLHPCALARLWLPGPPLSTGALPAQQACPRPGAVQR